MTKLATAKLKSQPGQVHFYHATLMSLERQPLFARGALPTVHSSLTYAVWYIYWMSRLDRANHQPAFFIYQLLKAERYLVPQGDGLYSVSDIGSIPQDDRDKRMLDAAPELFRKDWKWDGALTYIPAHCLQRVEASIIRQEVDLEEWLYLCRNMDEKHPFKGLLSSRAAAAVEIPDFLRAGSS